MATFTEQFTRMRQDFDRAHADRQQLLKDTHQDVENMVRGVRDQLAGFRQNMQDVHAEVAEMAGRVRTGLRDMGADLHAGGDIFRKGPSPKPSRAKKGQ